MTTSPRADRTTAGPSGSRHRRQHGGRVALGFFGVAVVVPAALVVTPTWWVGMDAGGSPTTTLSSAPRLSAESEPRYSIPSRIDVTSTLARRAASQVRPARPTRVALASGTKVSIIEVSTLPDGTLDAPEDIGIAGWWDGGARIGDPYGAIVVAAHVDSVVQALGPFSELLGTQPGDRLTLWSPHLEQSFAVTSVTLVPKGNPAEIRQLFSADGRNRLVLITCAGPYDPGGEGYQNIAVITAISAGAPERR